MVNIMRFQNFFLIVSILFFIFPSIYAISLFEAQNIAKEYVFSNEIIDSFSQPKIVCDNNSYYLIPVVGSTQEVSFFVPVSFESGDVLLDFKNTTHNLNLVKTEYVLRSLSYSSGNNYLNAQLIDKIHRLISVLESTKAKLEGLEKIDTYPQDVKNEIKSTRQKLEDLISLLSTLQLNLNTLLDKQNAFLSSPSCSSVGDLLPLFSSAFSGYKDLPTKSLAYSDSISNITTTVVASDKLSDSDKQSIISFIAPPSSLSSDVSQIYDYVSSTYLFYSTIYNFVNVPSNLNLFIDNFVSRKQNIDAKSLLYDYDSNFPNYRNLDEAIQFILNPDNKPYWVEQGTVDALYAKYVQINELYTKGKYQEAIPKIMDAKLKAKYILNNGFIEETQGYSINWYLVGVGIVLLIFLIFLFVRKKKKSGSSASKKQKGKDEQYSNFFEDQDRNDLFK